MIHEHHGQGPSPKSPTQLGWGLRLRSPVNRNGQFHPSLRSEASNTPDIEPYDGAVETNELVPAQDG